LTTLFINIRKIATEDTVLFPKMRDSLPEEITKKDYQLRAPRLRRTTSARNASSSGEQLLIGGELSGAGLCSWKDGLVGAEDLGSTTISGGQPTVGGE